jgi:tetratricopeptide (TPR) repeat protein
MGEQSTKKKADQLFLKVAKLAKEKKYDEILSSLLTKSHRLNHVASFDKNHAWYCVGNAYYRLEKHEEALRAFRNSMREQPDDFQAWFALGDIYSELELYRQSEYCFSTICEINPDNEDARYNLACAQMDQGNYFSALHSFSLISKKIPNLSKNMEYCKRKISLLK